MEGHSGKGSRELSEESNIIVPQLGESIVEARVVRWLKKEGDRVQAGEPVVELETEKINLEIPSERGGVLVRIARKEGDDVKVGDVLAVLVQSAATEGEAIAAPPAEEEPRATPTARRIAHDHNVDLSAVHGSGSAGRVMKEDVQHVLAGAGGAARASGGSAPAAAQVREAATPLATGATSQAAARPEERVRLSKRRLTIARRLVEAQHTAAMLTTFNEVDMTAVMGIRERHKAAFRERYGVGLGIASFFVRAAIAALRAFPRLNAEIQGDDMVLKRYYDIGIAVGAEGGLVVPVLRDADRLSFGAIETTIRDVATRANDGTLTLDDLKGGTFTITNGGVFGSLLSTPILNPPQVGILGLHTIADRPVAIGGQVVIRPMMYVALSYDHRLVDGREAVQFLVAIKEFVEDPGYLLLEG